MHALATLDNMPLGLKIKNRANHIIFDSAWIAGVDYDEEEFEDEEYDEEEESDDNADDDEYDEMDENELADIIQEPNEFQIPHETEPEQEIVFEEADDADEALFEDYDDEDFEHENEEDVPLEADDEDGEEEEHEEGNQGLRRTGRVRVPPRRYQHLQTSEKRTEEYSSESAHIIALTIAHYNTALAGMNDVQACSFLQTYSLKQGIRKFGEKGVAAANKELRQLHDRVVFEPISVDEMTTLERKRAMESLIFLNEKRDDTIKARMCANGSTQRAYISREEASSPTAASEAIITTGLIDAKQERAIKRTHLTITGYFRPRQPPPPDTIIEPAIT